MQSAENKIINKFYWHHLMKPKNALNISYAYIQN